MKHLEIKVCGVADVDNLNYLRESEVEYIGIIFVPDSRRCIEGEISPETFYKLNIPAARVFGVFSNQSVACVTSYVSDFALGGIQLHGDEDLAFISEIRSALPQCMVVKAINGSSADLQSQAEHFEHAVDWLLLDNARGGTGLQFDWSKVLSLRNLKPFFLAGGITDDDLPTIKTLRSEGVPIRGVDLSSSLELSPGIKSHKKIQEFIEASKL